MHNEKERAIKMNLIYLLQLLVTGVETSLTPKPQAKHDLRKKKSLTERLNDTCEKYFPLLCGIAIILCLFVFVWVCFTIVGISAVESGVMRNFINGGHI